MIDERDRRYLGYFVLLCLLVLIVAAVAGLAVRVFLWGAIG